MYAYVPLQRPGLGCAGCGIGATENVDFSTGDTITVAASTKHAQDRNAYYSVTLGWKGNVGKFGDGTKAPYIIWTPGAGIFDPTSVELVTLFKRYQVYKGIGVDGIFGPEMYKAFTGKAPPGNSGAGTPKVPNVPTPPASEIIAQYNAAGKVGGTTNWMQVGLIAGGGVLVLFGAFMLLKKKGKGKR